MAIQYVDHHDHVIENRGQTTEGNGQISGLIVRARSINTARFVATGGDFQEFFKRKTSHHEWANNRRGKTPISSESSTCLGIFSDICMVRVIEPGGFLRLRGVRATEGGGITWHSYFRKWVRPGQKTAGANFPPTPAGSVFPRGVMSPAPSSPRPESLPHPLSQASLGKGGGGKFAEDRSLSSLGTDLLAIVCGFSQTDLGCRRGIQPLNFRQWIDRFFISGPLFISGTIFPFKAKSTRSGQNYPGARPKSGIVSRSPPLNADWWATIPGAV